MFYDLNIPWSPTDKDLTRRLAFAHELGYNVVALNHEIAGKLPADLTCPILPPKDPPAGMTILTRCALRLDPSTSHQNARLASLARNYDLLALRPTDEKTLQQACTSLDCDIVSINLSERLGYWLQQKQKLLAGAVKEGKKVEVCYGQGMSGGGGVAERRNLISNATQLIRATRGRGLIFSSEARGVLGLRGPWDVINLATIWGLSAEKAQEGVSENSRLLLKQAALKRRGWRGVVEVVYGGEVEVEREGERMAESGVSGKKRKAVDGDDENGMVEGKVDKPISKREMKRRRKAVLQAGSAGNGERNGESGMELGANGAVAATGDTHGAEPMSAQGEG